MHICMYLDSKLLHMNFYLQYMKIATLQMLIFAIMVDYAGNWGLPTFANVLMALLESAVKQVHTCHCSIIVIIMLAKLVDVVFLCD